MLVVEVIASLSPYHISYNYGNPSQHLAIRAAGIQYLRENPERFIESNLETSWLEYLENMTMQGTWTDNIIIIF